MHFLNPFLEFSIIKLSTLFYSLLSLLFSLFISSLSLLFSSFFSILFSSFSSFFSSLLFSSLLFSSLLFSNDEFARARVGQTVTLAAAITNNNDPLNSKWTKINDSTFFLVQESISLGYTSQQGRKDNHNFWFVSTLRMYWSTRQK